MAVYCIFDMYALVANITDDELMLWLWLYKDQVLLYNYASVRIDTYIVNINILMPEYYLESELINLTQATNSCQ